MTKLASKLWRDIVKQADKSNLAFLIGNGLNRYKDKSDNRSWEELLLTLYNKFTGKKLDAIPKPGIALTEFFDLILIEAKTTVRKRDVQEQMVSEMRSWKAGRHHKSIVEKIEAIDAPIMTTNFDRLLVNVVDAKRYYTTKDRSKGFTAVYPWQCYYSNKKLNDGNGFGIWFLHGMSHYPQSIRLGLSDLLRAYAKADRFRPKKKDGMQVFKGENTWLKHFMGKSLLIFGLSLVETEVFIRWLLIERFKYLRRTGKQDIRGWYIQTETSDDGKGRTFFLDRVGIETLEFKSHSEFYEEFWERNGPP